jgi:hypothetical protein
MRRGATPPMSAAEQFKTNVPSAAFPSTGWHVGLERSRARRGAEAVKKQLVFPNRDCEAATICGGSPGFLSWTTTPFAASRPWEMQSVRMAVVTRRQTARRPGPKSPCESLAWSSTRGQFESQARTVAWTRVRITQDWAVNRRTK